MFLLGSHVCNLLDAFCQRRSKDRADPQGVHWSRGQKSRQETRKNEEGRAKGLSPPWQLLGVGRPQTQPHQPLKGENQPQARPC